MTYLQSRKKALGLSALVMALAMGLIAATGFFSRSEDKTLGTVSRGDLIQRVTVAGIVIPNRKTMFSPAFNAYVKKIFVKIGDHVNPGDPVVSFVENLRDNATPVYPLRAPFSGVVVQIPRSEGEYIEIGKDNNTVVRVDDLSQLFILCDVPESDIAKLKLGQEVIIKANGVLSRQYKGKITQIALAAKERAQWARTGDQVNFDVHIAITDADKLIQPGMSTIVDIITAKADNVLTLPHEYVEKDNGDYFVTLENGQRQKINVGLQNEASFQITSGVAEGQKVRMVDFFNLAPQS